MRRSSSFFGLGAALVVACGLATDPATPDEESGSVPEQEVHGSVLDQEPTSPFEQARGAVPEEPVPEAQIAWAGA